MRLLLTLLICTLSIQLFAQNNKPVIVGQETYFKKPDGEIKGIRATQVSVNGNDTILNNFYTFKYDTAQCPHDPLTTNYYGRNAYSPSWLGKDITQKPNGVVTFTNQDDEVITLQTWADIGTTWNAFDLQGGNYIEASVTSIMQTSVLGNTDSVKTITLQAKNSQGSNITHPINGSEIKLSKNSGFVQLLSFLEFPDSTTIYTITDQAKLTRRDVYDFNVGDVIQIEVEDYWGGQLFDTLAYITKTILSKTYSMNQETVEYSIKYDYLMRRSYYDYQNTHQTIYLPYESFSEIVSVTYDSLSNYIVDNMPEEVGFRFPYWGQQNDYPYYYQLFTPDDSCSRVNMKLYDFYGFYLNTQPDTCWYEQIDGETPLTIYMKGLGDYRHEYGNFHQYHTTPLYYQQGGNVCGTLVTGIEEKPLAEIEASIFPNPASDELNITFIKPIENAYIEIYDAVGKLVLAEQKISGNNFKLSLNLEPGIYFVNVSAENHKTFTGKVIIK